MQAAITAEFLRGIPEPIRRRLNLLPGAILDFDEDAPFLKAVPAPLPDTGKLDARPTEGTGPAKGNLSSADCMAVTRSELDNMMACIGIGKGKGSLRGRSSVECLEETRGPVELPANI